MREKEWRVHQKKADFQTLAQALHVSPYLVRILRNRGLTSLEEMQDYLYAGVEKLCSPWLMKNMDAAVTLLRQKIQENKAIYIIGDYDVDGICATAILQRGLRMAGAVCESRLPHRMKDGYGLNMTMVQEAIDKGVDTILTCDNGIAALEEIRTAKAHGLTVIVTDHHTVQEKGLPEADVIVNPHQAGETYPQPGICGAVVAWKVITALYEAMELPRKPVEDMIELAAMATVQDSMALTLENRIIVKEALQRMKQSAYPGIRVLLAACDIKTEKLAAYNLAFGINPCLNAGGRLDTAEKSLKLLLTETEEQARPLADELCRLNQERKSMQEEQLQMARLLVETTDLLSDRVLVVELPDCHESLAGLVAGKLKEEYYKPTVVLTRAETEPGQESLMKGSGRSIEAYSMFEELQKLAPLMTKFGGHPMAAGLTLPQKNVAELRRRLNENCTLTPADMKEQVFVDILMPPYAMEQRWVEELELLEPCGLGNAAATFGAVDLTIVRIQLMGQEKNHLRLILRDTAGREFIALQFFAADDFMKQTLKAYGDVVKEQLLIGYGKAESPAGISLIYEPMVNEFRGMTTMEMKIRDYHLHRK